MLYVAYPGKEVFLAKNVRLSNGFRKFKGCLINFSNNSYLFAATLVDKASRTQKGPGREFLENQGTLHNMLLSCNHCVTPGRSPTAHCTHKYQNTKSLLFITQRTQPPFFLFISASLLYGSNFKLRNKLAFTETGKYIFTCTHVGLSKLGYCISQPDIHTLHVLCETQWNFTDYFPHVHQGTTEFLLNCKIYTRAIAHLLNLHGKYQDFPNRKSVLLADN